MRKAFTLIELMIVIAIIAIIAAIAIPNLLESRITANEAAAATSLKSGLFPAQTQYQAGAYIDPDGDGRGAYACAVAFLSGATGAGTARSMAPSKSLSLMDPKFCNQSGQTGNSTTTGTITKPDGGTITAGALSANSGAYDYAVQIDLAANTGTTTDHDDNAESYWGGVAAPKNVSGDEARRMFAINATGVIFQSRQTLAQSATTVANAFGTTAAGMFLSDPTDSVAAQGTAAVPYQK